MFQRVNSLLERLLFGPDGGTETKNPPTAISEASATTSPTTPDSIEKVTGSRVDEVSPPSAATVPERPGYVDQSRCYIGYRGLKQELTLYIDRSQQRARDGKHCGGVRKIPGSQPSSKSVHLPVLQLFASLCAACFFPLLYYTPLMGQLSLAGQFNLRSIW